LEAHTVSNLFAVFAGSTVDGARYEIISIGGRRVTLVTSRSVDAIGAGVGVSALLAPPKDDPDPRTGFTLWKSVRD
jgi:hypothetical protein